MDEEIVDVVVVGAGIAGCVAATLLARDGREVYLLERGKKPGEKNLSGGVFYSRVMDDIFPDFVHQAPIERRITKNTIGMMTPDAYIGMDYYDSRLKDPVNAVSVLRARLDPWLAQQAEDAGAMVMPEAKVDELLLDDSSQGPCLVGVRVGEDDIRARVVVIAEGVNSFLARQAGIRPQQRTDQLGVGIKSLWRLDEETINERFGVNKDEGTACAFVGDCTQGVAGGGFLYTNKDSVSIGVILRLDSLTRSQLSSSDIHDYFVSHQSIQHYLQGGELIEYGSHMVNEGGMAMLKPLVAPGLIIIGDAGGFTLNTGLTIRGMDVSVESAKAAVVGIKQALDNNDYSGHGLGGYIDALKNSFIGQDILTYRNAPRFFDNDRIYRDYPSLMTQMMYDIYRHDCLPRHHLVSLARQTLSDSSLSIKDVLQDIYQGMTSL